MDFFGFVDTVVTLFASATTRYILEDDRLVIRRGGFVRMEIPYSDVDLIEYIDNKVGLVFHERLYRLALPKKKVVRIQIRTKVGFREVLINPHDPDHLIKTWYWARYPAEAAAQGAQRPAHIASQII